MPIRFYRRQSGNENVLGESLLAGLRGWQQGEELARKRQNDLLGRAYMLAKIGKLQGDTDSDRLNPRTASEVESGFMATGKPIDPNYRRSLANQFGYSSLQVGQDAEPIYRRPSAGIRGIERAQGFQTNF